MSTLTTEIIGYIALATNLYSMYAKGEYRLRVISAIANGMYVVYGILLTAFPIIIGASIAICLHIYRLRTIKEKNEN